MKTRWKLLIAAVTIATSTLYHHYNKHNDVDPMTAMHEAEKVLTSEQWWDYTNYLDEISYTDKPYDQEIISATASQRAEAFLHTVGKWKD